MKNFAATLAINQAIISHETHHLHEYANVMERVVAAEADRESYSLEESTRYLTPEERAEVYEDNADYLVALTEHFIFQHRLSLIVTIYAVFESHLSHLCKVLCTQKNLNYGLRDLNGKSNLDKARRLLGKFLKVPLNDVGWQRMEHFSLLRNIVAHMNGQLTSESRGKLEKVLMSFPDILDHNESDIKPKHSAAFALIDAVQDFFSSLYKELEAWGQVKSVAL